MRRSRSLPALIVVGARFWLALSTGKAPPLGVSISRFLRSLIRALRPHFFAFPAAAALAGSAAVPRVSASYRVALAALALGLAWGIGQLVNDVVDLEADAVDAPDRPLVSGTLPEEPTAAVALMLALAVTLAIAAVHAFGLALVALAAALLFAYGRAKGIAGLGNLCHGALMAVMVVIGGAATLPDGTLGSVLRAVGPSAGVVAVVAALYLQANYEKDRRGDAHAGYRTLAHVLGIRVSAALRALAGTALGFGVLRLDLLPTLASRLIGLVALIGWLISSLLAMWSGHERGALLGYRYAVHATTAALVALAEPRLGAWGAVGFFLIAGLLVERAFRLTKNP